MWMAKKGLNNIKEDTSLNCDDGLRLLNRIFMLKGKVLLSTSYGEGGAMHRRATIFC